MEQARINPDDVKFNTDDVVVYLAAAGAGKTSALMDEMTEMLKTYRPDEIAFVTYTRKGVLNGIERALKANPELSADDLVHFKTLHALCFRELGLKHTAVLMHKYRKEFNSLLGFHLTSNNEDISTDDDKLIALYDAVRSGKRGEVFLHEYYKKGDYERLIRAYEAYKETRHLVDFHDCLLRFCEAGKPVNVKAAFIDEAQDLTPLQWEVCLTAFSTCEKIRISGDDFQCLFYYSGASPGTLVSLARRYCNVKLETSHRLPRAVYRFAKGITDIITDKIDKDFAPSKDAEGVVECITDRYMLVQRILWDVEHNGASPGRWYLLFRNNCFYKEITGLLEQYYIPYHIPKGFCLSRSELIKIKRYYNFRKAGFGSSETRGAFCKKYNIEDIQDDFIESDLIPSNRRYICFGYVEKYGIDALIEMAGKAPYVLLSTTHKVKGGEADFVVVFLDCTRNSAKNGLLNIDEELRVLYVACTRAKIGLYIVWRKGFYGFDKIIELVREATEQHGA